MDFNDYHASSDSPPEPNPGGSLPPPWISLTLPNKMSPPPTSFQIKDIATVHQIKDTIDEGPILNPFIYNLNVTMSVTIPSYILLILFTSITFYIVYSHFRHLINIYLSVIFYLSSQLLLLVVLTGSWMSDWIHPEETLLRCRVKMWLQTFSLFLPGYCILIITVVRCVFVSRPLTYFDYIRKRYQITAVGVVVFVAALISSAPYFGLCGVKQHFVAPERYSPLLVCGYDIESKYHCKMFYIIVVIFGFLLPASSVVVLYIYLYNTAKKARKSHKNLMESSRSASNQDETRTGKERRSIPWSILAILGVCLVTTLPWAGMIVYTVEISEMLMSGDSWATVFDLVYSIILALIGCSPLVYLISSASLRNHFLAITRSRLCCGCKKKK